MRLSTRITFAAAMLAVTVALFAASAAHAIVGGTYASSSEWPFVAAIGMSTGDYQCGGALVSPTVVVTAAHCMFNTNGDLMHHPIVGFGATLGQQVDRTARVHIEPGYDNTDYSDPNDVAVLVLNFPVYRTTVPLGTIIPTSGVARAAGWGDLSETHHWSVARLRQVDLPVRSARACAGMKEWGFRASTFVCAGVRGRDVCGGDSGSPLVWHGALVGIVAFGDGCGHRAGAYSAIAAPATRRFIAGFLR